MADSTNDKTISRTNTGFPAYLDFDTLRSSAIAYLGNLTGKIWTDYNVHDPGITMLEVLIYALLDLGYRTNLPVNDLFTRDPADTSLDNNFFPASRILGNNPLTITDYRKLLVDISGVKNAWLEPDDKTVVDFCGGKQNPPPGGVILEAVYNPPADPCACSFLNGLYHAYIQLEDNINQANKHQVGRITRAVRDALMAHRNLCEDFIDIQILCKLELGICAEIDLVTGADAEAVYISIVEALQEYFSPAPKFYSLQQLLDRGKPIDEIFAGRPYNVTQSHGFVDTDEFEKMTLRKELHLSDVYHLLFAIPGINRIRNLGWIKCCKEKQNIPDWKLVLPENYIPSFSTACSGFVFTRNGLPEKLDTKKFDAYFEIKFSGVKKAVYTEPSTFLDPVLPQGVYRNDLADYYSIQNEFPRVYGISEGGLTSDEPDKRKAQALQLQGFLLFFDQLLANYLTQLKNIRSLFSLTSSATPADNHTYFINQLTSAPQLQQLLRFHVDVNGNNTLGTTGSILAYPTSRVFIQSLIDSGKLKSRCEDDFPPYPFCFAVERDLALNQLKDDLVYGDYQPVISSNANDCWFFYFFTSSAELALVSKNYYGSRKAAADAAASVKYAATFTENYRSFMVNNSSGGEYFGFDVELNLDVYAKYLQLIVEDQGLYQKRRQGFLDHLLSRFAESFTDYALLSAPFHALSELPALEIRAEERFLSHYDDISSNRGKAYDYLKNKWNTPNISGFEKRVKALAGIDSWNHHYLCNFVVEPADKLYHLSLALFDMAFAVEEKTFNAQAGLASLKSVYKKLLCPVFLYDYLGYQQQYQVYVLDDFGNRYGYEKLFPQEEQAQQFVSALDTAFKFSPDTDHDVYISRYIFKVLFTDCQGKQLAESKTHFTDKTAAQDFGRKAAGRIGSFLGDANEFIVTGSAKKWNKLDTVTAQDYPFVFINENDFEFRSVDAFHLKEERKRFSLLNKKATFQFDSIGDFPDSKTARDAFRSVLILLPSPAAYLIEQNKQTNAFDLFIAAGTEKKVRYFESFPTSDAAKQKQQELLTEVNGYTYRLTVTDPIPDEWEFRYRSGDESGQFIDYLSQGNYQSSSKAAEAATTFYRGIADLNVQSDAGVPVILLKKEDLNIRVKAQIDKPAPEDLKKAQALLSFSQRLYKAVTDSSDKTLMAILDRNRINPGEDYVYKLVDKDNLLAYHPQAVLVTDEGATRTTRDSLVAQALAGYNYVDIDTGNDAVRERKDGKTTWYHYLVKCNNRKYQQGSLAGQDLILFESTTGYASADDALAAFAKEYLLLLKYARDENNYGAGKPISPVELFVNSADPCDSSRSLAFIPKDTSIEFGDYEVQKIIAPMAASYPVRFLRKNKYIFVLGQLDEVNHSFAIDWKSTKEYETATEAMQRFQFFLILLKYPGNFYIEWSSTHCGFGIYIREVLAISAHGFATAADAWGPEGVEEFICVSQGKNGFHNYVSRLNCNPGFFVACGNTGLCHPCSYDTPARRDRIMDQLYQAAGFSFMDLVQSADQEKIILTDLQKNPLVQININSERRLQYEPCEWILHFVESVYQENNYVKKGGQFSLNYRYSLPDEKQERYYKLAEPVSNQMGLKKWKQALQEIACYFPVRRAEANVCSGKDTVRYTVEIKLPGFDPCCRDVLSDDPCSSPCKGPDDCTPSCWLAWKTDCCFDDCCQALDFYLSMLLLLRRFENYKPVYDCCCGSYRIELHPQLSLKDKSAYINPDAATHRQNIICNADIGRDLNSNTTRFPNIVFCLSEIVAINPQFYSNDQMACDAVARAKKLINSEGLHLVEHILLRPRCPDANQNYADCECDGLPRPCIDKDNLCHFEWLPGGDPDPCQADKTVCFTPGCDPYSFIATLILPAWPERFRSDSGRQIMEKLLQKEAPAHVLLRILWLRPRDFCCLEFYDKLWLEWLAHKTCDPGYTNCDFLHLLFKKEFEQLPDCESCMPCNCGEETDSCVPASDDPCAQTTVLEKINQLFCWSNDRKDIQTYCETGIRPSQGTGPILEMKAGKKTEAAEHAKETVIPKESVAPSAKPVAMAGEAAPIEEPKLKVLKPPAKESAPPQPAKTPDQTLKEKFRLVQSRAHSYEQHILALDKELPGKETISNGLIFLKKAKPTPKQYAELAEAVLKDKTVKAKNIKGLNKEQKQSFIENITWKYLDTVCFNGRDLDRILSLKNEFAALGEKGIDMKAVYRGWNHEEIAAVETAIDFKKIKKCLQG